MSRLRLLAAWVLVVVLATSVTWQIVSAADDRVSDRPVAPLEVSAPNAPALTTSPTTAWARAAPAETSTTSSSTTTSVATPTSSSTTPSATASQWQVKSVATVGGTVVVSYRPGEAVYQTATPAPGFRAEIEKHGPPKVEVEFESEAVTVEIRIEWRDGRLDVEITESD